MGPMRMNSPKNLKHGKDTAWETAGVLLDDAVARAPLNWAELFPERLAAPVEIEIGVGKGTFLLARAKQRPEINLLGIEYAKVYAAYTADRIRRAGLTNVRMLATDAGPVFRKWLPDESVWRVHVYFPDPWPKRKHNRRRLIQGPFARDVWRVLKPGGQWLIVTDHADYFRQVRRVLDTAEGFIEIPFPRMLDTDEHIVGTNFERKYRVAGRDFYRAALVKYV